MVRVVMVESERVQPVAMPESTASAPVDPEAKARSQFSLAENYRRAGLASKALGILRSVIQDFPNTAAAKEAKEQVKELEDEAKKAGKGS
jgi:lipopolysaccharide biosynthesis regulator YciM